MTVQQLKYILKVAEVGSITEAAKLLFISQPSLSNSIKETEKEVGKRGWYHHFSPQQNRNYSDKRRY